MSRLLCVHNANVSAWRVNLRQEDAMLLDIRNQVKVAKFQSRTCVTGLTLENTRKGLRQMYVNLNCKMTNMANIQIIHVDSGHPPPTLFNVKF